MNHGVSTLLGLAIIMMLFWPHAKLKPAFKAGDCVQYLKEDAEDWESKESVVFKIIRVGKQSYLVNPCEDARQCITLGMEYNENFSMSLPFDFKYKQANCPQ